MKAKGTGALKRTMDVAGAAIVLALVWPLLLAAALAVRATSPGPVLYRRRVVARQAWSPTTPTVCFDAFKLRTMRADADRCLERDPALRAQYEKEFKLRDDPRVTPVGRLLRRLSIDELPQLVNVLRGEMSLVGPRMISEPELGRYGDDAARLLSVRPGLTGLWQVGGRHALPASERVRLDLEYVERHSLWMDLAILARTLGAVVRPRGAY